MTSESTPATTGAMARIPLLDLARGSALLAMVIYHTAWDLSFFGLIEADIRDNSGWILFARAIAASFLVLVGIGLVLADPGESHNRGRRRTAYLKRLALITGAALLVTGGTYLAMQDNFIFFGILHAIAVSSVLALLFLPMPIWLVVLFAGAVFALPSVISFESFSTPWLVWLGLGTRTTFPNDFVPIFPWFGCVLAGIALAKAVDFARFAGTAPRSPPMRLLVLAGRNSLIIYLLHQPLLYGALALVAMAAAPPGDREAQGFLSSCQSQCRTAGGEAAICIRVCTCAVGSLKAEGLWASVLSDKLDAGLSVRTEAISRRCAEAATSIAPKP